MAQLVHFVALPTYKLKGHVKMKMTATLLAADESGAYVPAEQMAQFQAALNFNTELVAANPKVLFNSIAMVKAEMWDVQVEDLRVLQDFNIRIRNAEYFAHVRNLADSILANGFYKDKPLSGFGTLAGKKPIIYITDGHCRYEAVLLAISEGAPITELPVVIKDKSVSMEDLTVSLVRSSEGKRLAPLEVAIAVKRLFNFGWKQPLIAQKIGVSEVYVNQLLVLAGAPKAVRDMVESGEATAAVALDAIRAHGSDAQQVMTEALEDAKANGKTKLTARFLPEQIKKKACAKAAPAMFAVIEQVKAHKSFSRLPDDLKLTIEALIAKIGEITQPVDQNMSLPLL